MISATCVMFATQHAFMQMLQCRWLEMRGALQVGEGWGGWGGGARRQGREGSQGPGDCQQHVANPIQIPAATSRNSFLCNLLVSTCRLTLYGNKVISLVKLRKFMTEYFYLQLVSSELSGHGSCVRSNVASPTALAPPNTEVTVCIDIKWLKFNSFTTHHGATGCHSQRGQTTLEQDNSCQQIVMIV